MYEFLRPLLETPSGQMTFLGHGFDQLTKLWDGLVEYQMWIFVFTILVCAVVLFYTKLRTRHRNIKKLWVFILFFLTKRQMLIPLIWTFARREDAFEEQTLRELLQIRRDCRSKSLKYTPSDRLGLEQKVSEILYQYFTKLETQGKIRPGSKFSKIVEDLEFIDGKLVELQALYNLEAKRWNQATSFFLVRGLMRFWGMKRFDLFEG